MNKQNLNDLYIPLEIVTNHKLTSLDALVYGVLKSCGVSTISNGEIARILSTHEKSISRSITRLCSAVTIKRVITKLPNGNTLREIETLK